MLQMVLSFTEQAADGSFCCGRALAKKAIPRPLPVLITIWLETQPMGGEMYAKRNMEAGLNNQLLFMENQGFRQ